MRAERSTGRHPDRAGRGSGFSIVEALIAATLLLVVIIGVLPMYTQSILNNASGNDASKASQHGRSELDRLMERPFSSPQLVIPAGTITQPLPVEYLTEPVLTAPAYASRIGDETWTTVFPTAGRTTLWTRTSYVRQYPITALDDGLLLEAEAVPGGTNPNLVTLFKEIDLQVRPDGPSGPSQAEAEDLPVRIRLRVHKVF